MNGSEKLRSTYISTTAYMEKQIMSYVTIKTKHVEQC